MKQDTFTEKRQPILCANCGTPMVGMNKYLKPHKNIYVWYICPRRKASNEKGCGHKVPIIIKEIGEDRKPDIDKHIFEGIVKIYEKQTFVLDDNNESIHSWIHKISRDLEGKRIRVVVEKVEPDTIDGRKKITGEGKLEEE